jgi:HEAT repeats
LEAEPLTRECAFKLADHRGGNVAENKPAEERRTPIAFVAMCFDGRLQHVYHRVVKPVLDLTFENPNVFYELGITHVLKKPTIMLSQNAANIPFDIRHWRVIAYEDTKLGLLDLREALDDFLKNTFPAGQKPRRHRPHASMPAAQDELEGHRMALYSSSLDFRRYAIKFLGDYSDKASYKKIEAIAVGDHNSDIVRDAMTALHKIDPEEAQPVLLNNGLRRQQDFLVRERVVALIGNYAPDEDLLRLMLAQLGDSSWGVRCAVCEVLGRWGKSEAAGPLQSMLSDGESLVRLAAAEALERLRDARPS